MTVVLVFAAALMLASASCSASNKSTTTSTIPTIPTNPARKPSISISQPFTESAKPKRAFAGDSITFQSVADINAHYRNRYNVAIVAANGVDTYFAAQFVAEQAVQAPAVEVINLGTNDANLIRNPFWSEPKLTIASGGSATLPTGTKPGEPVTSTDPMTRIRTRLGVRRFCRSRMRRSPSVLVKRV
jgi:ABC-type glycerol-3-phosphate transport system substrate-binding protein